MPIAIPLIAAGISSAGGIAASKIAANAASRRSPEERAALQNTQAASQASLGAGKNLIASGTGTTGAGLDTMRMGLGTLAPAASYYGTLLRGNRAAQSMATAAPRGAITDTYRGAEQNLERSGVRGAQRDVASADLGRERASRIASLVTGVQPGAAAGLAGVGGQQAGIGASQAGIGLGQSGQGASLLGQGANVSGNLLGQGFQNRVYGDQQGAAIGAPIGGFLFDILNGLRNRKGGGYGGGTTDQSFFQPGGGGG